VWFALALGAALAQAGQFAVVKARARHLHPFVIMLWTQVTGLGVWSTVTWLSGASFAAPWRLAGWVMAAVVVAAAMNYLLARASAGGDLSMVAPILAVAPIVAIVPDWLFTGTLPGGVGWLGVAVTVLGTMTLSRGEARRVDVGALLRREDALCALGAAVAFGLLSAIDRRVTTAIGVPGYLVAIYVCQVPLTAVLLRVRHPGALVAAGGGRDAATLVLHAGVATASIAMQLTAVSLAPVAYVNSVRQLSTVFTVVVGRLLFGEPGLGQRLAGALLMGAGAVILLFAR
jgi:drug/metabolite transporter (DMT)-like permease